MENITEGNLIEESVTFPLWFIISYYVFVLVGLFLNLCVALHLLQQKQNGIFSSVLQLAAVDCLSTFVSVIEIWTINQHSWSFSSILCPFYSGSEVIINTFILYNIICINFHITSIFNLHLRQIQKESKHQLPSLSDEEDSEEFLVNRENQNYNRNVIIDYSRKKSDISIIFPLILVWFVGLSISIPQFTLSTTVIIHNNFTLCTIFDTFYKKMLQILSMIFRIIIPVPLLLISLLVLIKKLHQSKYAKGLAQNALARKAEKIQSLLVLGTGLTVMYIIASLQRQIFHLLHIVMQDIYDDTVDNFKIPPLENITCSNFINLISAMTHYASSTLRPFLYIFVFPELRYVFNFKQKFKCNKK